MKRRLSHTFQWLMTLFMGSGLTYCAVRFGVWPMLMQLHSATKSILGMFVFLFFTGIALFVALPGVIVVIVSLRELFRWRLKDD
jgi:hypothetical protein